jgi:hypothetical protein
MINCKNLINRFEPWTEVWKRLKRLKRVWVHGVDAGDRQLDEEEEKLQRKKDFFDQKMTQTS